MINSEFLLNDEASRKLFRRVIEIIEEDARKNTWGKAKELISSFSLNQIDSKKHLIELMDKYGLTKPNQEYGIMGCWFGSIIVPLLLNRDAKRIYGWDMDQYAISLAEKLFKEMLKPRFFAQDVWLERPSFFEKCDVIINTSCEHMPPMRDWPGWKFYFKNLSQTKNPTFIFQSNNMHGLRDHINTVNNLEEFEDQMHPMMEIIYSDEIDHPFEDGIKRFTIIGKMIYE
jgi:hypothetical protein